MHLRQPLMMLTALVDGGAHIDYRNTVGLTPMHKAAVTGRREPIQVRHTIYLWIHSCRKMTIKYTQGTYKSNCNTVRHRGISLTHSSATVTGFKLKLKSLNFSLDWLFSLLTLLCNLGAGIYLRVSCLGVPVNRFSLSPVSTTRVDGPS